MSNESRAPMKLIQQIGFELGVGGLIACAIGAAINPPEFFRAWHFGYMFWLQIPLGCMALVMLYHLVGGGWGLLSHRIFEAAALTMPLMAFLFIPNLLGMRDIFDWSNAEHISHGEYNHKDIYLNIPFFLGRAVFYFAVWNIFAWLLAKWSDAIDRTRSPLYAHRLQVLSGPGLVLVLLTITFASFDWMMSLEPEWYSTAYGMILICGDALTAMAFLIVFITPLAKYKPLADKIQPSHFHDFGNLLLAFLMLWAYVNFGQFLIIWSGNLPEEVTWYWHRVAPGWNWFSYGIIIVHFLIPFVLLLMRGIKRTPQYLFAIALAVLILRIANMYWMIAPSFFPERLGFYWLYLATPIAIGGVWLGVFARMLQSRPLLPAIDPEELAPVIPPATPREAA